MKNFRIIYIVGVLNLLSLFVAEAQTPELNLKKYWYYRERLKNEFMVVSDQYNENGTNLPAENRNNQDYPKWLRWADGGQHLGYYIAVLATEYRLLKDNGQDYWETLNELNNALLSFDRLDIMAEYYYSGNHDFPYANGFFVRDDVDKNFLERWKGDHPSFEGMIVKDPSLIWGGIYPTHIPSPMSQDQVWNMLVGLALVKKLVDEPWTIQEAKNIAWRIVDAMHYCKQDPNGWWCNRTWEIANPVDESVVQSKNDITWLSYGFGEAASWITDQDCHYGNSNSITKRELFHGAQSIILDQLYEHTFSFNYGFGTIETKGRPYNAYGIAALTAIGNISSWDKCPNEFLRDLTSEEKYPGIPTFPHLPLIHIILHDWAWQTNGIALYENLLNSAPGCGPYNYGGRNHSPYPWQSMSLIGFPWAMTGIDDNAGEYNGLDYMLLYNCYFLAYKANPYSYPYLWMNTNYPTPDGIGSTSNPTEIYAARDIDAVNTIQSNGSVAYCAGQTVKLLPGFRANNGSHLVAYVSPSIGKDIYYQKVSTEGICNSTKSAINTNSTDSILKTYDSKNNILNMLADNSESVKIYPNPTNGAFTLEYINQSNKSVNIELLNSFGKIVYQTELASNSIQVDISSLPKGIYLLVILNESNNQRITKKIVYM